MYSRVSKGCMLLTNTFFTIILTSAHAQETNLTPVSTDITFSVQPQQCVTLRQGRDCFATIKVQWQKQTEQSLCLYQVSKRQPKNKDKIICWSKNNKGQTSVEFESNDNLTYQLRTLKDDYLLAEKEVMVSWLHTNTTKRRRWRLF